jgi:hypothetical protein
MIIRFGILPTNKVPESDFPKNIRKFEKGRGACLPFRADGVVRRLALSLKTLRPTEPLKNFLLWNFPTLNLIASR